MKFSLWLIIMLVCPCSQIWAQKTCYYYGSNTRKVESIDLAMSYKMVKKRSDSRYVIKTFTRSGSGWTMVRSERIRIQDSSIQHIRFHTDNFLPLKMIRTMDPTDLNTYAFVEKRKDVVIRKGVSTTFIPLHLEGEIREYHPNKALKSIAQFSDNQLISNVNWLPDGSEYIDSIFYTVDSDPMYKFGNQFLQRYLIEKIKEAKIDISQIQDELLIGWVVMETGTIDGVISLQGKSQQLNDFFVDVIYQLPGEWEPARLNGSVVRCFVTFPINFRQANTRFQDIELSGGMLHYNSY